MMVLENQGKLRRQEKSYSLGQMATELMHHHTTKAHSPKITALIHVGSLKRPAQLGINSVLLLGRNWHQSNPALGPMLRHRF